MQLTYKEFFFRTYKELLQVMRQRLKDQIEERSTNICIAEA